MRSLSWGLICAVALLAACNSSGDEGGATVGSDGDSNLEVVHDHAAADEHQITIRTLTGEETVYLIDRLASATPRRVEQAVRESGYPCNAVKGFYQLEEKDGLMDVFKIDCGEGSYQITAIQGETYFKPWTGNIGVTE